MYKVRVSREYERYCPFSLMYLFLPEEFQTMKKSFRSFFGFQARFMRDVSWDLIRVESSGTHADILTGETTPNTVALTDVVPDILSTETKWQVGVPLGPTLTGAPSYLTNEKRRGKNDRERVSNRGGEMAYANFGYLINGPDLHKPPCLGCPFWHEHDRGMCSLGDTRCYSNLNAVSSDTFYLNESEKCLTSTEE